jgi:hypothetical protein
MKDLEPDLQRLSARFRACGFEDPFREESLKAVSPVALRGRLAEARGVGLLDEGPAWAQRGDQLQGLAGALRKDLQQQMELDRSLRAWDGREL